MIWCYVFGFALGVAATIITLACLRINRKKKIGISGGDVSSFRRRMGP